MTQFLKYLATALLCMTFYGKIGVPSAVLLFQYNFLEIVVFTVLSGFVGNIIFVNLSYLLIKWVHQFRLQRSGKKPLKRFSPTTRKIISVKRRFGLLGIAFVGPMFLSIPLAAYIAERFFKDKRRIILYFTISELFWTVFLYGLIYWFNDALKGWLI